MFLGVKRTPVQLDKVTGGAARYMFSFPNNARSHCLTQRWQIWQDNSTMGGKVFYGSGAPVKSSSNWNCSAPLPKVRCLPDALPVDYLTL